MTVHPLRLTFITSAVLLALAAPASAAEPAAEPKPPEGGAAPATSPPTTAVAALDRANAAYDYGDMNQVVESTRPIVEGALPSTPAERLEALRLLGIGLYLIGRPAGAEAQFLELLRSRPRARLDPTTTRPEVVAFFEDVRRRHAPAIEDAARARSRKSFWWNLLPPLGQFKNGDHARGWVILGVGTLALSSAVTTKVLLDSWRQPNGTYRWMRGTEVVDRTETARTLKTWNHISVGVLAGTWVVGVADALIRSGREPEEQRVGLTWFVGPGTAGLTGRF